MVGALNGLRKPAGVLLAQAGPPVPADVIVGSKGPLSIAQDNDAFGSHLLEEVVSRRRQAIFPANTEPAPGKDPFGLFLEDLGRHVVVARQGLGAVDRDLSGLQKL